MLVGVIMAQPNQSKTRPPSIVLYVTAGFVIPCPGVFGYYICRCRIPGTTDDIFAVASVILNKSPATRSV